MSQMSDTSDRADVVVVGAGLSGLVAAWRLHEAGRSVVVCEARDRVGGRTLTVPLGSAAFDLGGQWLGPGQKRVARLARELELETFQTFDRGRKLLLSGDDLATYRGTIPRLSVLGLLAMARVLAQSELVSRRFSLDAPWADKHAEALDSESAEDFMGGMPRDARETLGAALRTVFGAEPREVSALYFLHYLRAGGGLLSLVGVKGGAQERRFVRGAQALSLELAKRLGDRVRLGIPVERIDQSSDELELVGGSSRIRARFAVVAVPPALRRKIHFEPVLDTDPDALARAMPMGATVKVLALYDEPFWRQRGWSGEAVFGTGPLSVVFDNVSHRDAQAALVGFVVGDDARRFAAREPEERREQVLSSLRRAFGPEAGSPSHYLEHDWASEEWTAGCPVSSFVPGSMRAFAPALREPAGRIHWAGTETATCSPGYLDGAVFAGERAAREVSARC
jgi:monoamine oxidase